LLLKMARNIVTGLDIGTSSVRAIVCELRPGENAPQILALVKKSSRGLRRGYIINFEEVTETIKEVLSDAERAAKTKIRRVFLGIGGVSLESKSSEGSVIASRPDAEITGTDVTRVIEACESNLPDILNKQILHRIPIAFKLDGQKVLGRPEGLKGSKLEAKTLFITSSSQHLRDFMRAVEEAGGIVDEVVASPLAAGLVVLSKVQKMAGCVLVNIGSQTTSIAVFEEGIPLSIQVFPIGSTDITNDIALGFKIPIEDAERIKKGEGEPVGTKKKLDEIIEARLSDIFEFIEMHLKKLGRNGLLPAGIVITGGGSGISNIEDLAKQYFKLPAKLAQASLASNSKSQIRDSAWSVAYGLCVYGASEDPEESLGIKAIKTTQKKILEWIREFMP